MVGRGELTDRAWARVAPLLPAESGRRGGRWRSHRQVINAILWHERTGAPWRDLPERYGPWKTAHERLRKWTADGTWDRILEHVIVKDDSLGHVGGQRRVRDQCRFHECAGASARGGCPENGAARTGSKPSRSTGNASGVRGAG
ncbi:IS5 family transposase [Amycolatopsis sp. YIM 10]|uniref:IS5 family transposase n=1 Tax=Amycolatopsis sp. YIM 10 TaxID=2653857 RepID=UPI003519F748